MIFVGYDKSFYENDKLAIIHDILSRKHIEDLKIWLEDIISVSTDDLNIGVDEITINPSYYQEEDMSIQL